MSSLGGRILIRVVFGNRKTVSRMGLCQLLVGTLVVTMSVAVYGETCFYVDNVCPNGNISFWLRTRETDFEGIEITEDNLEDIPLIENAPLKVLIHGWTGHKNYSPNPELISAYLTHENFNIISVDWGKIALDGCYITSAYNVPVVGRCSARMLQQLYTRRGMHWKDNTHVIGFSLGAQVAGVVGYYLKNLHRVTGLDPALPLFTAATSNIENRLDSTDADFVDVYHTNGGWQGRLASLGHVDFYLNNGATQPGCHFNASCDHHRAVVMYAESINSERGFFGESCSVGILSYITGLTSEICPYIGQRNILVRAGEYVSPKAQGTYKIETNYRPPLAKGLPFWSSQSQMLPTTFDLVRQFINPIFINRTNIVAMGLLLLIGIITLPVTIIEAGFGNCFYAKDVCPSDYITFWLRTRKTGYEGVVITEATLDKIPLVDGPLIVLIHGYKGHKEYIPNPQLVKAYLKKGNYNIITVDWGKMAQLPCYLTAASNTLVAGKCTSRLLQQLYSKIGQHWKQTTHVIGFSLGAHVAGILGYHLPGLPRITGLDPAFPGFSENDSRPKSRLDPSDALFVDVYHSNCGLKGRPECLGHVDFYLNNGRSQPGCHNSICNHHRAVEVFAETINNPEGFYGQPCDPKVLYFMTGLSKEVCPYSRNKSILVRAGESVSHQARGSFKFETNAKEPFGKGLPDKRTNAKII